MLYKLVPGGIYERTIKNDTYKVVIETYKKHVKQVVTAYITGKEGFTVKHVLCV
ncbi:hypothetical protein [Clostridium sp. BL-8]|uniref:hypothetical protein n=1 Tax=Clostridium sp. BL-8 TaxID=349938 RepID=UPI0009C691DC|nr:hypothetical protein [Clostridium sp. BL-8]OOM78834.1 hypothetical protein CLOBL_20820 [Clostridium sp. BL-8]